jgi:hypothetical protein
MNGTESDTISENGVSGGEKSRGRRSGLVMEVETRDRPVDRCEVWGSDDPLQWLVYFY